MEKFFPLIDNSDKLRQEVISRARLIASQILKNAYRKREQILKKYKAKAEEKAKQIIKRAEIEAKWIENSIIAEAFLKVREKRIKEKWKSKKL